MDRHHLSEHAGIAADDDHLLDTGSLNDHVAHHTQHSLRRWKDSKAGVTPSA
jgi:hypothetical protein